MFDIVVSTMVENRVQEGLACARLQVIELWAMAEHFAWVIIASS